VSGSDHLHLRDARLLRALQEAPDAQSLPDAATRSAILEAAARAVAQPAAASWWRRLWSSGGQRSLPWNAAFATVALATLVTVLWREQEIPGATPEGARDRQAPAAAVQPPAVPPAAAPAPAQPEPSLADRTPRPAPPEPAREARARSPAPVAVPAPTPAPVPTPPPAAQAAPPEAATRDAAAESAAGPPAGSNRGFAAPAPAPAPAARPPPPIVQASPRADTALSKAAPAAEPARMQRRETVSALPVWDRLQLTLADGRVIDLARGQGGRLPDLLVALAAQATGSEPLAQAQQLRIVLLQGDAVVGTLEIAPPQAAWRPAGGGGGTVRPDAQMLRELMEEATRLGGPR
jgi:hypothetical protein